MKVFISADIEGVSGMMDWQEAIPGSKLYDYYARQMSEEVAAACKGAIKAGAKEIVVKDAHAYANNIDHRLLPKGVKLIRGWSGNPLSMMHGLDASFSFALYIAYHSAAGTNGNPLAHSFSSRKIAKLYLNNELASEFLINSYIASMFKVPSAFISGDQELCEASQKQMPDLDIFAVKSTCGAACQNLHPDIVALEMAKKVEASLKKKHSYLELPANFKLNLHYHHYQDAYKASFYPGASLLDTKEVEFRAQDYFDVLTAISFLI